MAISTYDYAIIGAGAAGLHLAMAMIENQYFNDKKILLLDKDPKLANDKTWCFWEKGNGKWGKIVAKQWTKAVVGDETNQFVLDLEPFSYKMIHALDFYNLARSKIEQAQNLDWEKEDVEKVDFSTSDTIIHSAQGQYAITKHVFDSRISPEFEQDTTSTKLLQHFKGFVIKTEEQHFDESSFVMMDFSLRWKDSTSFTYVLPYSPKKALVEFTFFNANLIKDQEYDHMLKKYIKEHLNIDHYEIEGIEKGVIPMSDFPFHTKNSNKLTKIGTAGGWVKPSSGYSFKNAEKISRKIITNLCDNKLPSKGLFSAKHRYYDAIFLSVLIKNNELGPKLFTTMYGANRVSKILKFLDEDTSFIDDLKIMNTFPKAVFGKAVLQRLFHR